MRFEANAVEFVAFGIPIIGNLDNGYVIGLTPEGQEICHRLSASGATEEEIAAIDKGLLHHLKKGCYFETSKNEPSVRTAYLHVTQRCNLNCVGCYSYDEGRNELEDMSLEDIFICLDYLRKVGTNRLIISGGEPFMRDDLGQICHYAKHKKQFGIVEVLTNGTLLNSRKLNELSDQVDRISVSFDGTSSEDRAYIRNMQRYEQLVDAIDAIKAHGIRAHISPTIHSANISAISDYKSLANKLGATISFSLFSPVGNSATIRDITPSRIDLMRLGLEMATPHDDGAIIADDTPINTNLAVKAGCGAGCSQMSISASGEIYPCHMLHCEKLSLGNIISGELPTHDQSKKTFPIQVEDIAECKDCEIRYFCGAGCRARAYRHTGSIFKKDPYCELMKSFYSHLLSNIASIK